MKKTELEKFKQQLLAMRDRLWNEIDRMAENVVTDVRELGEHDNTASEAIDKEIILEHNEEEMSRQVVAALQRIENGTFGQCEDCGSRIAKARLEVLPYATYCIKCEREHES